MEGSSQPIGVGTLDPAALDALTDLLGGDVDALADVVDACLEGFPSRIAEIHTGAATGDAALAGRAAHTLKSNALTFGALNLAKLAAEAEVAARSGDLPAVAGLTPALDAEWASTRPLLCELRDRGDP